VAPVAVDAGVPAVGAGAGAAGLRASTALVGARASEYPPLCDTKRVPASAWPTLGSKLKGAVA
jgi:hypothetical protein